jgi:hypothetical protein
MYIVLFFSASALPQSFRVYVAISYRRDKIAFPSISAWKPHSRMIAIALLGSTFSLSIGDALTTLRKAFYPSNCQFIFECSSSPFTPFSVIFINREQRDALDLAAEFDCKDEVIANVACDYHFAIDAPRQTEQISEGGWFAIFAYRCFGIVTDEELTLTVHWPWGWLDRELYPILYIAWIECVFYTVLLSLWIRNRVHHKSQAVAIHNLLMVSLVLHVLTSCASGIMYVVANLNPAPSLTIACDVSQGVSHLCILFMCMAFATGLSTVYERIPTVQMTLITIIAIWFALSGSLLGAMGYYEIESHAVIFTLLILYVIGYLGFVGMCLHHFRRTRRILRRHLILIYQQGIQPERTPTWRQMRMLARLRLIVSLAFLAFVGSMLVSFSRIAEYWVASLITIIMDMAVFSAMCYLCRIRSKMATVYGDDESAYAVEDGNLREWKPGMVLPPMPSGASHMIHPAEADVPDM